MKSVTPARSAIAYARGKRALASHDTVEALRALRSAVDGCPVTRKTELARRLYWLSVALLRLGKDGLAVKALSSAQRLAPRGRARDMYERIANDYGMPRSSCVEHDDYRAFCSIQVRRYLERVPDRRFATQEEIDTVLTIVADAWMRMESSSSTREGSCDEKLKAFRDAAIDFPTLRAGESQRYGKTIAGDFFRGRALRAGDRCSCGSGLQYGMCCGRTRLPFETERG